MQVYRVNPSGTIYEIANNPLAGCKAWPAQGIGGYYIEVRLVTREGVRGVSDSTEIRICMTDVEFDHLAQALAKANARE